MKNKIYKILDNNLIGSYETKQKCADEILRLFGVSGQSELFYCVSSDSLVHGKSCEKWCGNHHCKDLVKQ